MDRAWWNRLVSKTTRAAAHRPRPLAAGDAGRPLRAQRHRLQPDRRGRQQRGQPDPGHGGHRPAPPLPRSLPGRGRHRPERVLHALDERRRPVLRRRLPPRQQRPLEPVDRRCSTPTLPTTSTPSIRTACPPSATPGGSSSTTTWASPRTPPSTTSPFRKIPSTMESHTWSAVPGGSGPAHGRPGRCAADGPVGVQPGHRDHQPARADQRQHRLPRPVAGLRLDQLDRRRPPHRSPAACSRAARGRTTSSAPPTTCCRSTHSTLLHRGAVDGAQHGQRLARGAVH